MDDLVEWLRAQLDADERDADGIHCYEGGMSPLTCDHIVAAGHDTCTCRVPARLQRDIEAKRRILDEHVHEHATSEPGFGCRVCDWQGSWEGVGDGGWCLTVRLLALPYSDRPGHREEWRP